ncbi:octopamine receptor beta-2R [Musca domestica]|uniref:Octopamine receptor beta-2R n=1 Tax=Musca domestica TaxID=7370 RepID=A0A1I8MXI7_MUSDO|nr:octopamine receptor beta-2R [Musca domestica]
MQNVIYQSAIHHIMDNNDGGGGGVGGDNDYEDTHNDNYVSHLGQDVEENVNFQLHTRMTKCVGQAKSKRRRSDGFAQIQSSNNNWHNFSRSRSSQPPASMSSHLLRAITTAAATIASVTAAATTTAETMASSSSSPPGEERLKFVYDNSAAMDENIINNTLIYGTSLSGVSAATSYMLLNDSWLNASSPFSASSSSSSSSSLATSIAPALSTLNTEGVNVTSTANFDDDWSHFNDLILSWQGVCLIAVFCVLIVITIIGNTLVIMAVITTRRLKTVTNCFVMSLAVADFLVGIFVMPPAVAVHLIGSWKLGWILCDIWISLDVLLCTASILSLCAISVDRYLAVTRPLTYSRKRRSKRLALIMILIVWVLALAITCPPILGWYEPGRRDLSECRYNQNEGYVIFSAMGSFFIPMAVMIYVYVRISCVVAARHDNMTDISIHNNKKFKRYTSADVENELDPDISELDLSSGQKKQAAARTLSNQTLAKELHEIMASDNEVTTQCHSLLATPSSATVPSNKNGCYELTRASSMRRTPTGSSNMTLMTTTTTTGGGTATASTNIENPWTFAPNPSTTTTSTTTSSSSQPHYQQHSHPNKAMRTHSIRHQHYMSAPPATLLAVTSDIMAPGNNVATSILRQQSQPITSMTAVVSRSSHHSHGHNYTKSLSNRITSLKKENKTTQTLSIVVGGFIACWLPFFVYYLITPFLHEHQVSRTLAKGLTWLGWCNSAINPFIYAFYSVDFRAAFWRLTCKRFFSASNKPQFPGNTMSIRR